MLTVFGQNIRHARQNADMTQDQLAEKSGVSQGHLSAIERGTFEPKLRTIIRLSKALKVRAASLIPED